MARFVKGDVVVVPFPISAVPGAKRRPAVVIASWRFGRSYDYLLCLISSQRVPDPFLIELEAVDVTGGSLERRSFIRPTYLFAADEALIVRKIGALSPERLRQVVSTVVDLIQSATAT